MDQRAIRTLYDHYTAAVAARNLDAIMVLYANDVVVFDAFLPRKYVGIAAYRKDYEDFFAAYPGPVKAQVSDLTITVVGSVAYAYGIDHWTVTDAQKKAADLTFRFTDVLRKKHRKWLIVHEHVSFPVDPSTGAADFASKP
jgi:uncharacterized protein (TIGR02246 family)